MSTPVTINLQLQGMAQITAGLKATSQGLSQIAQNTASAQGSARAATGVFSNYVKQVQALNATVPGTLQHADALARVAKAAKSVQAAQKQIAGVPSSSRGSRINGVVSGLASGGVNGVISALENLGPLGVAAATAAAALVGLVKAGEAVAEFYNNRERDANSLGTGNPGDAAAANALGGADKVRATRERAASNPQFAADTGIPNIDPQYDPQSMTDEVAAAMKRFHQGDQHDARHNRIRLNDPDFATSADNLPDWAIDDIQSAGAGANAKPQWVRDRMAQSALNHAKADANGSIGARFRAWLDDQDMGIANLGDDLKGTSASEHAWDVDAGKRSETGPHGKESTKSLDDIWEVLTKTLDWNKGNRPYGVGAGVASGSIPGAWTRYQALYGSMRGDFNRLGAFTQ